MSALVLALALAIPPADLPPEDPAARMGVECTYLDGTWVTDGPIPVICGPGLELVPNQPENPPDGNGCSTVVPCIGEPAVSVGPPPIAPEVIDPPKPVYPLVERFPTASRVTLRW